MVYRTYTVVNGDTLGKVAKKYNTTVKAIQAANATLIKNVNTIRVGWVLKIPVPETSKPYETIGKQLATALRDVQNLPSVKKLMELLEG